MSPWGLTLAFGRLVFIVIMYHKKVTMSRVNLLTGVNNFCGGCPRKWMCQALNYLKKQKFVIDLKPEFAIIMGNESDQVHRINVPRPKQTACAGYGSQTPNGLCKQL